MHSLSLKLPLILAFFAFTYSVHVTVKPLKDIRDQIIYIPYSPSQRLHVATKAKDLFSIYVNRAQKIDYYSNEFPNVDPIPRIDALIQKSSNMTDHEFHAEISDIFLNLRDEHTNYYMPGPHSCFLPVIGVYFNLINSPDLIKTPILAVERISSLPEILDLSGNQLFKIELGDILLRVNGLSFKQYYQNHKWNSNGANEYGGMRRAAEYMSYRTGLLNQMPTEDYMNFELYSHSRKSKYSVQLPWITIRDDECYRNSSQLISDLTGSPMPFISIDKNLKTLNDRDPFKPPHLSISDNLIRGSTVLPLLKNAIYQDSLALKVDIHETSDKIIRWYIYSIDDFKMGVIILDSFEPTGDYLKIIRDLLVDQLKDTDALLIDVRSNGGGLITMANEIPQLFQKDFKISGFRALVCPINQFIFQNSMSPNDPWNIAYSKVIKDDLYTELVPFGTDEASNLVGTSYFKPVGVFTNAACYSACDLFSANMQDSGAAIIFGEDDATGAGGANVIEYNTFLRPVYPEKFTELPFATNLSVKAAPNMRVGWRQQVRNGKNDGKLVEDYGIKSDYIIRPSFTDFYGNNSKSTQLDKIARILRVEAEKSQRSCVFFMSEPLHSDQHIKNKMEFNVTVSGLDKLTITDESTNQLIGKLEGLPCNSKEKNNYILSSTDVITTSEYKTIIIQGYKFDREFVKTKRMVRLIPALDDFIALGFYLNFNWDFDPNPGAVIYNIMTSNADGWTLDEQTRSMFIGNGTQYDNNVNSKLSVFVQIPESGRAPLLSMVASFDTEDGCDFFTVGYISSNGTNIIIFKKSGVGEINDEFELTEAGPTSEIFFQFESDEFKTSKGVSITSLMISP